MLTRPPVCRFRVAVYKRWELFSWNHRCPTNPIRLNNLCDPSLPTGPRILAVSLSTTRFRLVLRRLTLLRLAQAGTLGLSAGSLSPSPYVTSCQHSRLQYPPPSLTGTASLAYRTYTARITADLSFDYCGFSPVTIFRRKETLI